MTGFFAISSIVFGNHGARGGTWTRTSGVDTRTWISLRAAALRGCGLGYRQSLYFCARLPIVILFWRRPLRNLISRSPRGTVWCLWQYPNTWIVHETRCLRIFVQPLTSSTIQQQVRASFMRSASSFPHPRAKENMKTSTTLPLYGRVAVL